MPVFVVITGALGHIGSRLIRELPSAFPGIELLLLDNLSTQRHCSLFDLPACGRYRFQEADILMADMPPFFHNADAVIHLAAATDAAESIATRGQVERVNYDGTERVAQACAKTGVPLIFLSTTSVYGKQAGLVDEDCPIAELRPQSPYAESKLKAEWLLQELGGNTGLSFVICRLGTIFGISPGMRFHTAINKFCWQAANGVRLTVWRTAMEQERPYLELGDAVEALKFILKRKLFDRRTYNVLTLNTSVRHIVETISAYVPDVSVEYVDSAIMNQLSYQVANRRFGDLGFEFTGNLENEIGDTLRMLKPLSSGRAAGAGLRSRNSVS